MTDDDVLDPTDPKTSRDPYLAVLDAAIVQSEDELSHCHDNERGDRLHVILDGLALLRRLADTERPWEDYGH